MKKRIRFFIVTSAYLLSLTVLLSSIFELQYSIIIGPFLDLLFLSGLIFLCLIFSIICVFINGFKKLKSYIPGLTLIFSILCSIYLPVTDLSHRLHYTLNRKNLESINTISQLSKINEMTDLLRYHKSINEQQISNEEKYKTKVEIETVFGDYLFQNDINIDKVVDLRKRLVRSDIVSLSRSEDYLVLTIDGFVDNEYGYVKSFGKELKIGDYIPPYGFCIVRLYEFRNGWYFYYST